MADSKEGEQQPDSTALLEKETAAVQSLLKERVTLRAANLAPGPHRLAGPKLRELKSDLKKATAFSKRVKGFTADQLQPILADLKTINVSMFVSELAQSLPAVVSEGKLKGADYNAFVVVWSNIHQRYEKFQGDALTNLKKTFSLQTVVEEMETKMDVSVSPIDVGKVRVTLRCWCDLLLHGLLPSGAFVDSVVGKLLATLEGKSGNHLTLNAIALVLYLLRSVGPELLPAAVTIPTYYTANPNSTTPPTTEQILIAKALSSKRSADGVAAAILKDSEKQSLQKKLIQFLDKCLDFSGKLKKQVETQWKTMCEATELRGELSAEGKEKFAKIRNEVEKYILLSNQMALSLSCEDKQIPLIDLSSVLIKSSADENVVFQSGLQDFYNVKQIETVNRFDDDEQRQFYEVLIDIEEHKVSQADFRSAPQSSAATPGAPGSTTGGADAVSSGAMSLKDVGMDDITAVEGEEFLPEGEGKSELDYDGLEKLSTRLHQNCAAKDYIDQWCVDYLKEAQRYFQASSSSSVTPQQAVSFYNNATKRLVGELRFPAPNSPELFPFYARAVATFSKLFSDLGSSIAGKLLGEVTHAVKDNVQNAFGRKMRGVKYVAELVKFRVAPPIRAIRLMHLCLESWSNGQSVEMLIALLERVGPFLMRGGVTKEKMVEVLDMTKKALVAQGTRTEYEALLENALVTCRNAPLTTTAAGGSSVAPRIKVRSPLELYVRHLLFSALNEGTFIDVRNRMRTLPWTKQEEGDLCARLLRKAYRCSWDKVHLVAELIADVSDVHGWVGVMVSDAVLETLRLDLEYPHHRHNQKRLQDLKFLGELYNFQIVSEEVMFYVMAQLILYYPCSAPPPVVNDYSRIRLITTMLETAGPYLLDPKVITANSKVILHALLVYFFALVHTKARPLPLDLDYKLQDTISTIQKIFIRSKKEIIFPKTRKEAEELMAVTTMQVETNAAAGLPAEGWLLELLGCLGTDVLRKGASVFSAAPGTEGGIGRSAGASQHQHAANKDRIYSVAQQMAPVGMDISVEDAAKRGQGPRVTPIESHRQEEEEEEEDDESTSGSSNSGSDSGSSYSDSDSSSSDDDSESSSSSGSSEEEEEEEEDDIFSRGKFTKGGDWGMATRDKAQQQLTDDDREFAEMLMEVKRDAVKNVRGNVGQVGKQSVDRAMEDKLPASLAPFVKQVRARGGAAAAPSATTTTGDAEPPSSTAPQMTFAVLRRGNNERVEAKALHVPLESTLAQKAVEAQTASEKEKAEVATRVLEMSRLQREQDAAEERASARLASRGRGGRGRGRGGAPAGYWWKAQNQ